MASTWKKARLNDARVRLVSVRPHTSRPDCVYESFCTNAPKLAVLGRGLSGACAYFMSTLQYTFAHGPAAFHTPIAHYTLWCAAQRLRVSHGVISRMHHQTHISYRDEGRGPAAAAFEHHLST